MTTSTSSAELTMLDTNVLVYAHDQENPFHQTAKRVVLAAETPDAHLCIAPQVLAEFFAVVTNSKRVKSPRTPTEALAAIEQILQLPGLTLLPTPADVVARWTALVRQHEVTGQKVFDVQLIAVMLGNGIKRIHTFNRDDFIPFTEIEVVDPV